MRNNLFLAFYIFAISAFSQEDYTKFVNPMIGTGGHGHVFPGPTMPFGKVQLSPDNRRNSSEWDWSSGYHVSDSVIVGFSHTHLSGTGVADLGDILITPYVGAQGYEIEKNLTSSFSHNQEKSEVGYYKVFLKKPKVLAELTASHSVGFHQYTFPKSQYSTIVVDPTHKISFGNNAESQVKIENDSTLSGYRISAGGWARLRKVFFVIKFSKPFYSCATAYYDWDGSIKIQKGEKFIRRGDAKMAVTFNTNAGEKIKMKVSISMVNLENAFKNQDEIRGWDFEGSVENAKKIWNNYLSKIKVEGNAEKKTIFYTSLYHTMIAPNQLADADGKYFGPDYDTHTSKTGNFYSTFSLWDTYRALHPLLTILTPTKVADMVNSMMEHYQYNGYLPIWTLWGSENHCMIANHSIPVIVDAYLKGILTTGGKQAFEAMKVSSTTDHSGSPWQYADYNDKGYFSSNLTHESVSKTLESSFNDWCVAQMAKKYGTPEDYSYFIRRSEFYKNLFNPAQGIMWPKDDKGNWLKDFSPTKLGSGHVTEGNSWQYNWSVQHNPAGLFALYPSKNKTIEKLDSAFNEGNKLTGTQLDVTGLIGQYAHGNEPSHHVIYFYNYLGLPKKTQFLLNKVKNEQYRNDYDGLSGNEDCGQMSAWYIFNALGFYPVNPTGGVYDIGTPTFPKSEIMLENGKKFTILAPKVSDRNIYVKSLKLNGKPLTNLQIDHADIQNGGVLEYEMSSK